MNNATIENIHERIIKLPFYHQLAFVYFVSKRQLPNYIIFNQKEKWGNPNLLQEATNLLEKTIITQTDYENEIGNIVEKLEKVTPDTDDFAGFLTSLALDACASLLEGFEFIKDKDTQRVLDICSSTLDLAQMYIEFRDNTDFDDYCFTDPLFEEELRFQFDMIEILESKKEIDESFLVGLVISKSKLGELLTGIKPDEIQTSQSKIDTFVQFDEEVQESIKKDNINLRELIPELVRNFYLTMKKVQNRAAL